MAQGTKLDLDVSRIEDWLEEQGFPPVEVAFLSGDVSPRRYARIRLRAGKSLILAFYPDSLQPVCDRFRQTTGLLERHAIPVPAILAQDCHRGLMLLEDAGEGTLYDLEDRPWPELLPYFESAIGFVRRLADLPADEVSRLNPPLDESLLDQELQKTWDVFLQPQGLTGNSRLTRKLRRALVVLCAQLGEEPPVPCHRDFMARNLVPVPGQDRGQRGDLVVLDHQDLRLGPPRYDLASLLNDSLFPPPGVEDRLLVFSGLDAMGRASYHRAAAQRTLKAIGTFASFAQQGSNRHLPLVAPTLARAHYHLGLVPETRDLARELELLWRPRNSADLVHSLGRGPA